MKIDNINIKGKAGTAFPFILILVLLIYGNTFHASFQFDDKPNIVDNTRLHITDLTPSSLWQTFFAKGGKNAFFRPIPSLSLALNWYAFQDDPFAYHLVNIAIHIITAFLLYITSFNLLHTSNLKGRYHKKDVYFISLLCAVLWAVNPIQTQAVTYIVQRMASMAAMFSILGIYLYLKGRLSKRAKIKMLFYTGCCFSIFFAVMSKENAAMMPLNLLLVEIIFFQDMNALLHKVKSHLLLVVVAGTVFLLLGVIVYKIGVLDFMFRGYASRPFTLVERLLTEPRIVLFYISQIFYPVPDRLSITHDIIVSKSLLSPWTTLPAILIILLLLGIGVSQIKKRPLVAFSILFFFLNHIVESTILPLELIFEHRNYLPSFFVFLPVAAALRYLFNFYQARNRSMIGILATFITLIIIGLCCLTYIRNRDWRTETTLWRDAMQKAPRDARPVCNLAIQLAWSANPTPLQYEVAMSMFNKALLLNTANDFIITNIINNIGALYYKMGAYQKAAETHKKGLEINPGFLKMRYDLVSSLIMFGKWEEASVHADLLIENKKNYINSDYFKLKGFILLWQKKPEEALSYFRKVLEMEPNNRAVLLNTGVALSLMGKNNNAEFFLKKAIKASPGDIRPVYALIENSIRAGSLQKAENYIEQMFAQFSIQTIVDGFEIFTDNYRTAPMSSEIVMPVVKKKMVSLLEDIGDSPTAGH